MIESTWTITIGLHDEANPALLPTLATFRGDYAAFRKRLSRRESLRAAVIMHYLYHHPITSTNLKVDVLPRVRA